MIRIALLGLGKMGLSHQAIVNSHPDVDLVAVCDTTDYLLDVLTKYTGVKTYSDYRKLFAEEKLDAALIATPSRFHAEMVRAALDANLHVFCEKPFCLDVAEGRALAELATQKNLVNQVGYHYRFVEAFHEMKRLLDLGIIGKLHHILAEAYGPVVLRPKGRHLAHSQVRGRRLPVRLCKPCDRPRKLSRRPAAGGRRHFAQSPVLSRRRGRGLRQLFL